jgi:hypothetical protein
MASVHLGRLLGPVGFSRTVAIKRLHAQFAKDPDFVAMFLDEARLVARIRHPNVVPTLDVVQESDELLLVMEYVQGESFAKLLRRTRAREEPVPIPTLATIFVGILHGLHAAHEATGEHGEPLEIVHRDVSPQNILVGSDGVPRLLDFGVAKASQRSQSTRDGQVKGKLAYMAPEQVSSDQIDRRCDLFAAGALLWEALVGKRLFEGDSDARVMQKILTMEIPPPSGVVAAVPPSFDAICARALSRDVSLRFATARDMALAIEKASALATASEVGAWVERLAHDAIAARVARVKDVESRSDIFAKPPVGADRPSGSAEGAIGRTPSEGIAPEGELGEIDVTIAASPAGEGAARSRWPLAVAAVLLLLGLAVAAGFALRSPVNAPEASTVTTPTAEPLPTPPSPPAPSAEKPPPVAAAPAVAPPPQPTLAAAVAPKSESPKAPARPLAAPKPRGADCSQPFAIDSAGIKHVKPECL